MKIGALTLFKRTSSKRSWNIASWHSSHNLTWSWIIGVSWVGFSKPRPVHHFSDTGFALGLTPLARFWMQFRQRNAKMQTGLMLFGAELHWHSQHPVSYRSLYQMARDRADNAERQMRLMQTFAGVR